MANDKPKKITSFRDLEVYQNSYKACTQVMNEIVPHLPESEKFDLKTNKDSILFLTNSYPDFDSSYRGIFIKKMACLLQKESYKICIVTPKIYKNSRYLEEQNGIRIYRFPFLARNKLLIEYGRIPYLRMLLYYISGFFLTLYAIAKNQCESHPCPLGHPNGVDRCFGWKGPSKNRSSSPFMGLISGWPWGKPVFLRGFSYIFARKPCVSCAFQSFRARRSRKEGSGQKK